MMATILLRKTSRNSHRKDAFADAKAMVRTMNCESQLSGLRPGQAAIVRTLSAEGAMRRRLQDMGLIEGTRVECIGLSPLGDPAAYLIRGAVVALRKSDADGIAIDTSELDAAFALRRSNLPLGTAGN